MAFNPGSGGGGGGSIAGSSDVNLSSPQNSQVLAYDSGNAKWQNQTISGSNPTLANLPAGSTISRVYSGSSWPSRGTSRTDITVQWLDFTGSAPVPSQAVSSLDLVVKPNQASGNQPHDMYLGALNSPVSESNWLTLEAQVGRMGMNRSFSPNLPSSAPTSLSSNFGKRASWHSVKSDWVQMASGSLDSTVVSFLNSIPADHELMLTLAHEPENDNPLSQEDARSAEWRAAQAHFYQLVKSIRPQTLVGPILMSWTFNSASGRKVSNWTISAEHCDFYGVDVYNPYYFPMVGSPNTWHNSPSADLVKFNNLCIELGVPGAVGETASAEDRSGIGPQRKVDWLNGMVDFAVSNNYLALMYFNAYKPGDTAEDMLITSSPESISAWAGHVAQYQRGVK